jgi:D-glycero-D-manno-heptose 1,7-bisphosphate phosphatase
MAQFRSLAAETSMIGDSLRDLQAGAIAKCRRILVRTGNGAATQAGGLPPDILPVSVHENLRDAVDMLLEKDL